MSTVNLQDNLNWLLIRASMITKQRLMKLAEERDLTLMQALTLCLIQPGQLLPMSALTELLAIDPSSVTGVVDRLFVGSYIERREGATDRRVKTIALTPAGVALRNQLMPRITERCSNFDNFSDTEIQTLKLLLAKSLPVSSALKQSPITK
jgi:DNA-binding MarR family transcriptional regulator